MIYSELSLKRILPIKKAGEGQQIQRISNAVYLTVMIMNAKLSGVRLLCQSLLFVKHCTTY